MFFKNLYIKKYFNTNNFNLTYFYDYCNELQNFNYNQNFLLNFNFNKNFDLIGFFYSTLINTITCLLELNNETENYVFQEFEKKDIFFQIFLIDNFFLLNDILNFEEILENEDLNCKNVLNYYTNLNEFNFESNNFNSFFLENSFFYKNVVYFFYNSTEFLTIIFIYIFITFIFYSSILENLTSYVFFNNKYKNTFYKNRNFIEVLLKLRKKNSLFKFFQ